MALIANMGKGEFNISALTEKVAVSNNVGVKNITGVNIGDLVVIYTQETTAPAMSDMELLASGSVSYTSSFQLNIACIAKVIGNNPSYTAVKTGTSSGYNGAFALTLA